MADAYGSPGASAGDAIRQALLQRAALTRQSAMDQLTTQKTLADIELTKQQRTTQAANEQSLSDERAAKSNTDYLAQAQNTIQPGLDLSPEQETALRAHGYGHLIIPSTTPGGKTRFKGTSTQLESKRQRDALQTLVDDPDTPNGLRVEALGKLAGMTLPAGVAVEKPTSKPLVRSNTRTGAVEQFVDGAWVPNSGPVPADAHFFTFTPESQNAGDNATASRTDRAHATAVSAIDKSREPISQQMSRGVRLLDTLTNSAGGPGDTVAIPEFLTVNAGGFGSGLRMSNAEITSVFGSQGQLDKYRAAFSRWTATGETPTPEQAAKALQDQGLPVLIQPAMREQMKRMSKILLGRAADLVDIYDQYEEKLNDAKDSKEVYKLRAEMRKAISTKLKESEAGTAATAPGAAGREGFKVE